MLKRISPVTDVKDQSGASVAIGNADFPSPFVSGLEYAPPARGTWNIVHVGMLIPEAHEIFVCASNCLRGVVLTAAEMGDSSRFSTVTVKEENVLEGDMEELIIEGVSDILNKLPQRPRAVLVYTSCIHHFMGCDLMLCYRRLRDRFPDVDFTDCYMTPIMRKSGITPDEKMRMQLYSLLDNEEKDEKSVNIIGNNIPTDETSDLVRLIKKAGYRLRDITLCRTYDEYREMGKSAMNISYNPVACPGGEMLRQRLSQEHLYLPLSYTPSKIRRTMSELAGILGTDYDSAEEDEKRAEDALKSAADIIGDTAIAIDYTATPAPLSLAKLLIEHGFRVERIYLDAFNKDEEDEFIWLKENRPELMIYATVQVKMRMMSRVPQEKVLAIGQKAAYFTGTDHFVNIVEGGGMYGFDGICRLSELMKEAFLEKKDTSVLIQQKGLGCRCFL